MSITVTYILYDLDIFFLACTLVDFRLDVNAKCICVVNTYLLSFSYALLQRDIHSMASSSCSWCSCVKLPVNCVTGHLCSRCSIVSGCWPQWLQVGVFLFPHLCRVYVVLQWPLLSWFIKTHSPRDSTGFLSPGRGSEGSSIRDALLTTKCCHWFVNSNMANTTF